MFQFLKSKFSDKTEKTDEAPQKSWLGRLADGLKRTRSHLSNGLANLILGKKTIDDELLESLETLFLLIIIWEGGRFRVLGE